MENFIQFHFRMIECYHQSSMINNCLCASQMIMSENDRMGQVWNDQHLESSSKPFCHVIGTSILSVG